MFGTTYTDATSVMVGDKSLVRVGSLIEWVAFMRAGYAINSTLRPIKGNKPTIALSLMVPELGRYVAAVRAELAADPQSDDELLYFLNSHSAYFAQLRSV